MKWNAKEWTCFILAIVMMMAMNVAVAWGDQNGVDIFSLENPLLAAIAYTAAIASLVLMVVFAASITSVRSKVQRWREKGFPELPTSTLGFAVSKTMVPGTPIAMCLTGVVAIVGQNIVDLGTIHGQYVWSLIALVTGVLYIFATFSYYWHDHRIPWKFKTDI